MVGCSSNLADPVRALHYIWSPDLERSSNIPLSAKGFGRSETSPKFKKSSKLFAKYRKSILMSTYGAKAKAPGSIKGVPPRARSSPGGPITRSRAGPRGGCTLARRDNPEEFVRPARSATRKTSPVDEETLSKAIDTLRMDMRNHIEEQITILREEIEAQGSAF